MAFVAMESGDVDAMLDFWGAGFFHLLHHSKPRPNTGKLGGLAKRLIASVNPDRKYNLDVDEWYDPSLDAQLRILDEQHHFDIVITEYVFLSRALDNFPSVALKLIDTHDVFANRHKIYLANRAKPEWFSTTHSGERKGLRRADVIIAIQENEQSHFQRLTGRTTITVGHLIHIAPPREHYDFSQEIRLLFVASDNPINIQSLRHFLDFTWPRIRERTSTARLVIAGRICNALSESSEYQMVGEVRDIADAYRFADIAINPVLFGTGLNIKSIEALGFSLPLISTTEGAKGMPQAVGKAISVAGNDEEWADLIYRLGKHPEQASAMSQAAHQFALNWNHRHMAALTDVIGYAG